MLHGWLAGLHLSNRGEGGGALAPIDPWDGALLLAPPLAIEEAALTEKLPSDMLYSKPDSSSDEEDIVLWSIW